MRKQVIIIIFSLVAIFQGCLERQNRRNMGNRTKIAIYNDPDQGIDPVTAEAVAGALTRESFEITYLSSKDICDTTILTPENYFLFVVPASVFYPENGEKTLIRFIQQKGNLMIIGKPQFPGQPLLETISPGYKMYDMHEIASLRISSNQGIMPEHNPELPVPEHASSCFRRPTGKGFECGYTFRWIPIITALDKNGLERGTTAWMLINQASFQQSKEFKDALKRLIATTQNNEAIEKLDVEGSVFAVCAVSDPEAMQKLAKTPLFGNMARRISKGLFLSYGGAQEFSYWPGEIMKLGAVVVNYGSKKENAVVNIRVTGKGSREVIFEKKMEFTVKPGNTVRKTIGDLKAAAESGGYEVRTELKLGKEVIDIISHEVGVLSEQIEPREAFITVKGTDFWLKNKKWNPVGVNYWPRSAIATEQVDYLYHWLTPGYYDPDQVEDDLQRLQDIGVNFVAVRADYIKNRRSILDFLRRCRNHNIFVYLFLQKNKVTVEPHYFEGIMMPFMFQKRMVEEFIEETRITENPALFAWDLIWEPSNWLFKDQVTMFGWNGNSNFRQRWDKDWAEWIEERYGSLKNAEMDWGMPVPRNPQGQITSPSSDQFEKDGPWRIMVAAYRRFMSDLMNRFHNDTYRTLHRLDPNHLISYRQGNLPPTDYTLTSTLKHVDFFSMEAYSFPPKENGVNKVGFVNRYLSYALENKPFMWNEYGYGGPWGKHTRHLDGEDVEYQFEYVDMVNREAYKNGANGIAPWWYPGGLRASEKTDFGITTPEGTLRPSGESLKKFGELYHDHPPERPLPDMWLTIDPDSNSGGLWYIVNEPGAQAYEEMTTKGKTLGVRTRGTGTNSTNVPLLAVGNTVYNGRNPPKFLNAEFNWFRIQIGNEDWIEINDGDTVHIMENAPVKVETSVGNLQEATWLTPGQTKGKPGGVYLASTEKSDLAFRQAIDKPVRWNQDTDFGGNFMLTEGISNKTKIEMQMMAAKRAWFGEKLQFVLIPEPGR